MANPIDDNFIVKAVIRGMIDVLGIHGDHIDKIKTEGEVLVRVVKVPYLSIHVTNGTVTIVSIKLDNVRGMLQLHQLLNDQFKKYGVLFSLSAQ